MISSLSLFAPVNFLIPFRDSTSLISGRKVSMQGWQKRGWHRLFLLCVFQLPSLARNITIVVLLPGNLSCPHCLQFPPIYTRWEADMIKEERLYSLARNPGAVGQTRPPCCWSGRWLSYSSLKERELGWWKTLRTSGPRGFEKQEPQEGRCLPRPLELLAPDLVWKYKQNQKVLLLRVNTKDYRTLAVILSHSRDFRKCAQRKRRGQAWRLVDNYGTQGKLTRKLSGRSEKR